MWHGKALLANGAFPDAVTALEEAKRRDAGLDVEADLATAKTGRRTNEALAAVAAVNEVVKRDERCTDLDAVRAAWNKLKGVVKDEPQYANAVEAAPRMRGSTRSRSPTATRATPTRSSRSSTKTSSPTPSLIRSISGTPGPTRARYAART